MNESLLRRGEAAILPTYPERPLGLVRGAGCTVWDEQGTPYLDLVAGLAVCSLGHGHPAPAAALSAQAFRLGHVSNLFWSEPAIALAERLHTLAGFGRVFFCNSGAEAVEAGVVVVFRDTSHEQAEEERIRRELDTLAWVGRIRDAIDEDRLCATQSRSFRSPAADRARNCCCG